jgi:hypothetical protein
MKITSFKSQVFLWLLIGLLFLSSFKVIVEVKGWFLAGSAPKSYDIGIVKDANRNGNVAYLKSIKSVKNKFGTIMQSFSSENYNGKRIKLTGFIKSEDIEDWAGMWLRVDGHNKHSVAFDNMQDRPIKATTPWTKYEIVLDVPENSKSISYGVLLSEEGSVWLDDLSFTIVENGVKTTGTVKLKEPTNTSFDD